MIHLAWICGSLVIHKYKICTSDRKVYPLVTVTVKVEAASPLVSVFFDHTQDAPSIGYSRNTVLGIACTFQHIIICKDTWGPYLQVGRSSSNFSFAADPTGSDSADALTRRRISSAAIGKSLGVRTNTHRLWMELKERLFVKEDLYKNLNLMLNAESPTSGKSRSRKDS